MRIRKRWTAAVLAVMMTVGTPLAASAAERDFTAYLYGPGVENLSVGDSYAQYQWGLKNDGELAYQEIINRFQDSHPSLAWRIDLGNYLGIGSPVEGPDAYRLKTIMARRGADINVLPAWNLYEASTEAHRDVVVAVIDTGIDFSHPELTGAAWVNEDEIPGDGIDNDGNGYIDDVNGWNFFSNTNQIFVGSEDSHGTHAAGTIAAERGSLGIAGIADSSHVKIMSLKALGTESGLGEERAVIEAIRYAEANGASICNLSFGTKTYYPELEQVMRDSQMLFVVAAGNGDSNGIGINIDEYPDYPSSYDLDNIISVANLMFDGNLHESSDYGVKTVDIAAPGTYIVSTTAGGGYGYMTGTSMAAPMVTGLAAFLYSYRTDISLSDIKPILLATARKSSGLTDKVACGGFPDAYAALTYGRDAAEASRAQ
ncbi:MAG: S8 family serine peptidase [Clostridiales bacterium]|nr:S8 family serine peptidase [Clostridiales bacterium]